MVCRQLLNPSIATRLFLAAVCFVRCTNAFACVWWMCCVRASMRRSPADQVDDRISKWPQVCLHFTMFYSGKRGNKRPNIFQIMFSFAENSRLWGYLQTCFENRLLYFSGPANSNGLVSNVQIQLSGCPACCAAIQTNIDVWCRYKYVGFVRTPIGGRMRWGTGTLQVMVWWC